MNDTNEIKMLTVCTKCGKVKNEHHGWDVSCEMNSVVVREGDVVRDEPGGYVVKVTVNRQ